MYWVPVRDSSSKNVDGRLAINVPGKHTEGPPGVSCRPGGQRIEGEPELSSKDTRIRCWITAHKNSECL
jgi:hypothetical protein